MPPGLNEGLYVLGFVTPDQVPRLNRSALPNDGIVVADVKAREIEPGSELAGVQVNLDGSGDNETPCNYAQDRRCDGVTAAVVQQIGADSFDPGHGVILTKTKTSESDTCGSANCFAWVVDSHPDDIGHVDFVKPDGTPKMATLGDERQLNDASFNAGTNSGSSYEYEDTANGLHFYIVDKHNDAQGILHYTIGVQSLDGNGPRRLARHARPGHDGRRLGYLHVPADQHRHGGGDRSVDEPVGRDQLRQERRLPPRRLDERRRLERAARERAGDGEVRRDGPGARVLHARRRRRFGDAEGDVRQRPVQDGLGDLRRG